MRRARDLGFGLDQARALLDFSEHPDRDCVAVDAVARVHLAEVDRKLADLVDRCGHGRVAECRIIGALLPEHPRPNVAERHDGTPV